MLYVTILLAILCAGLTIQVIRLEKRNTDKSATIRILRGIVAEREERIKNLSMVPKFFTPTPGQLEVLRSAIQSTSFGILLSRVLREGKGKLLFRKISDVKEYLADRGAHVDEQDTTRFYHQLFALKIISANGRVEMDEVEYEAVYGGEVLLDSWLVPATS